MNVILIGMPGSGKTTIGRRVAAKLGLKWVDGDEVIESNEGKTLAQLIEAHGMQEFLQIEGRHVRSIAGDGLLVSPGGSVVYVPETMEYLQRLGTIVYLDVPLAELEQRLGDLAARGVAIAPGMTLGDLFNEREPLYKKYADEVVAWGGRSSDAIADEIVSRLSGVR